MIIFYIISTVLSLWLGVLFFKKFNNVENELTPEELEEVMIKRNVSSFYNLSYADRTKFTPIGLKLWVLLLLIIGSFIPILNFCIVVILLIVSIISCNDNEQTFKEYTGYKVPKFIMFLNKQL